MQKMEEWCLQAQRCSQPNGREHINRIVHKESNSIVVKKSEVSKIIDCVYQETKDDGAAKLKIHTSHQHSGISRRIIQANLTSMKQNQ